ncbi:hypothetical protein ABFV51_28040, partial [Pseudomonas asgharzadehiana]
LNQLFCHRGVGAIIGELQRHGLTLSKQAQCLATDEQALPVSLCIQRKTKLFIESLRGCGDYFIFCSIMEM